MEEMVSTYKLSVWERLQKEMTWRQLGEKQGLHILDYGSGNGVMASHYAKENTVIAIEPDKNSVENRERTYEYKQLCGGFNKLKEVETNWCDLILCHNVFEYAEEREQVMKEFARVIKQGGIVSILKHNLPGRIMQMTVLLNDFDTANELLDGKNGHAKNYGTIQYYKDQDLVEWCSDFSIEKVYGQRTFWDLQQDQQIQQDLTWQKKMLALEQRVENREEFLQIAFFHHVILRKK